MALDAAQKAKLQEKKLERMYRKRAKVTIKDFELFKLNVALMVSSLVFILIGCVIMGVLLNALNGKYANADLSSDTFNSNDKLYTYYAGAQIGSVVVGTGVFILIMSIVGFIDDYFRTKKRLIEKIIKEDQERAAAEAAKNANMNIFQMLALNIKNSKYANQ